nr:hypothetical protein [Tanacetum cinerariifolium]
MKMVPYEAFASKCGAGNVVLRESYQSNTRGKLYYACPKSNVLRTTTFSQATSTSPSLSAKPSTTPIYYGGSSTNTECSNCKHLLGRIKVLQATLEMYRHPEQHTLNSAALLHDLNNDMEKLSLE